VQFHQLCNMGKEIGSPGDGHTFKVDRIHLFFRMEHLQVTFVTKFITGENHENAHCRQQAGKSQLNPFLFPPDAVVVQKVVEPFILNFADADRFLKRLHPQYQAGLVMPWSAYTANLSGS